MERRHRPLPRLCHGRAGRVYSKLQRGLYMYYYLFIPIYMVLKYTKNPDFFFQKFTFMQNTLFILIFFIDFRGEEQGGGERE